MTERNELLNAVRQLKCGDTVYAVKDGEIFEFETKYVYLVSGIYFVSCKSKDKTIADESFAYYEFGKIVFFTKEEAEQALKEREVKS